ncbi:unnamed protein product, partial [Ectocarpus fasciculatus]
THPEGPNIGFGSDPSWLSKGAHGKTDLLHTGNIQGGKLLIIMVGLPGRGKTYIARKVSRYLRWISYRTRVFSLAKYRYALDKLGSKKSANFFDPQNKESYQQRVDLMTAALEDVMRYLNHGGEIAILDGTNTTQDRRDIIRTRAAKENGFDILWIESICDADQCRSLDEQSDSIDFINSADYQKRIEYYQQNYTPLSDNEGASIKLYNNGQKLKLHGIHGFLRTKIASFVMNLHAKPRPIFLTRHGENVFNSRGLIGGDSELTTFGQLYAAALDDYMQYNETGTNNSEVRGSATNLVVWCSTMLCARETAQRIKNAGYVQWRALRELEAGICDGLTYEQIRVKFPSEYRAREQDKLRYRYPRGESYFDVATRLEPIIFELERNEKPLIIVAHQAVLRCLYAYFLDIPMEELPYLSIPLHTLIKLEPMAYGCKEKRVKI